MHKKLLVAVQSALFGFRDNGIAVKPMVYKKITVVYSPNIHRPVTVVKTWSVAVTTSLPAERFETHAAWMLSIMVQHAQLIADIAFREHYEMREAIGHYRLRDTGNLNRVKTDSLAKHEASNNN